jgi:hypothetical protein
MSITPLPVREGLKTAADLMMEVPVAQPGEEVYSVAVYEPGGEAILKIDVHVTRRR